MEMDFLLPALNFMYQSRRIRTNGVLYLDGSLGYIGAVKEPVRIEFQNGRIVDIEENEDGKRLKTYIESLMTIGCM